jgi:hypothetical protein
MAAYERIVHDLAPGSEREEVVPQGKAYDGVIVTAVPGGTVAALHLGEGTPPFPVLAVGQAICVPPEATGLYVTNSPGAGNLELIVSYSGVRLGTV